MIGSFTFPRLRAADTDVKSVLDLANKVVTGVSMLLVQHQAKVFADNGMSVYQDVAQVAVLNPRSFIVFLDETFS